VHCRDQWLVEVDQRGGEALLRAAGGLRGMLHEIFEIVARGKRIAGAVQERDPHRFVS